MRNVFLTALAVVGLAALAPSQAGVVQGPPGIFSDAQGAIRGYDPVAYFTEGQPVKGSREFSHRWKSADWYFASAENLAMFREDPERYAPQYGGYCAYAMSKGRFADTDPEAWTIHEGKLYLNHSKRVRERWSKDIPGNIRSADRNWRRLGRRA